MGGSLAGSALIKVCRKKAGSRKMKLEVHHKGICHVSKVDPVQLRTKYPGALVTCLRSLESPTFSSGLQAVMEHERIISIF